MFNENENWDDFGPMIKSDAQLLSENRARGEEMKVTLAGIPFHENRIFNEEDQDFNEQMKAMCHRLIQLLEEMEPVAADLSEIDQQLQYAADAWSAAVVEGCYHKARWSVAALAQGIRCFRTRIPPDKADNVGEVLDKRLEQAIIFTNLIRNAEAIDRAEKTIQNLKELLDENNGKLAPVRREIREAQTDPEKLKMLARIQALQLGMIQAADLNETETEVRDMLDEGVRLSKNVALLQSNLEQAKHDLNMARNGLDADRARLCIV